MISNSQVRWLALVTLGLLLPAAPANSQPKAVAKPIRIILSVEAEGPQGMWMQAGKDLSSAELKELRSLITERITKLPNHKLAPADTKDEALGLAVVAEKLQSGRGTYILLSSAVTISKPDGIDVFVSHDVIAALSLALAANAVVGQLTSVEFRLITGIR